MSVLANKLKFSHSAILDCVDNILPAMRNVQELMPYLKLLHIKLMDHFNLVNKDMFLLLRAQAQDDSHGLKMIEFLEVDLRELKVDTFGFLDQYLFSSFDTICERTFPKAFSNFAGTLKARIKAENEFLLPFLEKTHY